jgi:hypothetical protein
VKGVPTSYVEYPESSWRCKALSLFFGELGMVPICQGLIQKKNKTETTKRRKKKKRIEIRRLKVIYNKIQGKRRGEKSGRV